MVERLFLYGKAGWKLALPPMSECEDSGKKIAKNFGDRIAVAICFSRWENVLGM